MNQKGLISAFSLAIVVGSIVHRNLATRPLLCYALRAKAVASHCPARTRSGRFTEDWVFSDSWAFAKRGRSCHRTARNHFFD
jgi:hypothetical protein